MLSPLLTKAGISLAVVVLYALFAYRLLKKRRPEFTTEERFYAWITAVLPFCYGGFYTISAVGLAVFLLIRLIRTARGRGTITVYCNLSFLSLIVLVFFYLISVFWAANQGMALYGAAKFFPIILIALILMQLPADRKRSAFTLVPLTGVVMLLLAYVLRVFQVFAESQFYQERVAGFFEYPNTFALFLMIGIAELMLREKQRWPEILQLFLLEYGVFATGSRMGFGVMIVELVILGVMLRRRRPILILLITFLLSLGVSQLISNLAVIFPDLAFLGSSTRYQTTASDSGTLIKRFLYYKDSIKVILKHPFGLGYWGFASMEKTFQHGIYSVTYIHNDLLQLLMDIGWAPTILFCVALGRSFFRRGTDSLLRLVMFLVLGYSMLEFHLQYLSIWLILIPTMDLHTGKKLELRLRLPVNLAIAAVILLAGWLGVGEAVYVMGFQELCATITPVYTNALVSHLIAATDIDEAYDTAVEILKYDRYCSIAYSMEANMAYSQGDVSAVLEYKKKAIENNKYELDEYLDYFDKLYEIRNAYLAAGDSYSAEICRLRILEIPDMLQQVKDDTDPIAWKLNPAPELDLPEEYLVRLQELEKNE